MIAFAYAIMRNSDIAADIVQDAMTKLWEQRRALDDIHNSEAYCVTVTRRLCLNALRNSSSAPATIDIDTCQLSDDSVLPTEQRASLHRIALVMSRLPLRQRRVLKLSAVSGLDNDEIASVMGLSEGNVRQLLHRARLRFKDLFDNCQ